MTRNRLGRAGLIVAALLIGFPLGVYAASTISLTVNIYDQVVDEQDTTDFYHNGTTFCSGSSDPSLLPPPALTGDLSGPVVAYDFGSPWTVSSVVTSTEYVDRTDCSGMSCLRVQFNSNPKIMTLDTRGTVPLRKVTISFAEPCGLADGCPGPAGSGTVFGGAVTTPILLNVFLDSPFTSMAVCSSAVCPEAEPAFAKLWFTDPVSPDVTWRVDWHLLRVLRMSATTWYFIADLCDGTQIAGLSRLIGNRTRPKTVFNGYYKIPFFLAAKR